MILGGDLNTSFRLIDLCDPNWVADGAVRPADSLASREMAGWMRWMLDAHPPKYPHVGAVIESTKRWPGLEQEAAPEGFHANNMNKNGFGIGDTAAGATDTTCTAADSEKDMDGDIERDGDNVSRSCPSLNVTANQGNGPTVSVASAESLAAAYLCVGAEAGLGSLAALRAMARDPRADGLRRPPAAVEAMRRRLKGWGVALEQGEDKGVGDESSGKAGVPSAEGRVGMRPKGGVSGERRTHDERDARAPSVSEPSHALETAPLKMVDSFRAFHPLKHGAYTCWC